MKTKCFVLLFSFVLAGCAIPKAPVKPDGKADLAIIDVLISPIPPAANEDFEIEIIVRDLTGNTPRPPHLTVALNIYTWLGIRVYSVGTAAGRSFGENEARIKFSNKIFSRLNPRPPISTLRFSPGVYIVVASLIYDDKVYPDPNLQNNHHSQVLVIPRKEG